MRSKYHGMGVQTHHKDVDDFPIHFHGSYMGRRGLKVSTQRRKLRPLLVELCKSIAPKPLDPSGIEQQDFTDEEIDDIVCRHMKEIGDRFRVATQLPFRKEWPPEPSNQVFLDVTNPQTTLSAISDWSSTPRAPPSLQMLSQKAVMGSIRESLVGAKASAAFCCGASVPFRASDVETHTTRLAEVAPVTVHWDDKQAGPGSMVFSRASSEDPQFHQALEELCQASEPASFGRGGETVFDGTFPRHP
jgi:hypothetical protein